MQTNPKGTLTGELQALMLSKKQYSFYVAAFILVIIPFVYFFARFFPWDVDIEKIILILTGIALYGIAIRYLVPQRVIRIAIYSEILFNVFGISTVVYFSGGVISPFIVFLIIPIFFATFLLGKWIGMAVLALCISILAIFIFLPAGLPLNVFGSLTFFFTNVILLSYLTFLLFFLSQMMIRVEEARRKAQERVWHLEKITERLRELDRLKNEFISRASHQLRTPLNHIEWGLQTILEEPKNLTEEQKRFLQKMYDSSRNLVRLVSQLLDISRIEEGTFIYKKQKVDLPKMLNKIILDYAREIKEKKISVHIEKAKSVWVFADPLLLEMALSNIISNAVLYNREKGEISVNFEIKEDVVLTHIRDTGIGIPKEEIPFIFKRFYRGRNAASYVPDGTGLGLSFAKEVLERQGGTISLESEEKKWTEVSVSLPKAE
jgi:signal transduction histidine kinase